MSIFSFHLTYVDLIIFYAVAMLVGMSKTGVHGAGMLAVPMLAVVFGGQASTGILLPVLCFADILGLWYYHRHASWDHLRILFPWAAAGTIAGTIAGEYIDDRTFKIVMAIAILASIAIMLWLENRRNKEVPHSKTFSYLTGTAGGFTSMVGNLAGPLMAVYFLSMRLPKYVFIGTTAWFFLAMNFFKVPFHVFHWKTITTNSILLNITTIPSIVIGAWLGVLVVRNLSEKVYRRLIIVMTIVAAAFMLLRT